MQKLSIRKAAERDEALYELLLLADPSKEIVDDYLVRGECYTAWTSDELAGVYVLLQTRPKTIEIVNIAVKESLQNRGFGKQLVRDAIEKREKRELTRLKSAPEIPVFISCHSIKNADSAFRLSTMIFYQTL